MCRLLLSSLFPASLVSDSGFLRLAGSCPEIGRQVTEVEAMLSKLFVLRLQVESAKEAGDAAVKEFPRMRMSHLLAAAKLEKSKSILTVIGPEEVVDAAANLVPRAKVIFRGPGNFKLQGIHPQWRTDFWETEVSIETIKKIPCVINFQTNFQVEGGCNAKSVGGDRLVSWDPRWLEISRSILKAIESRASLNRLPVSQFQVAKLPDNLDLPLDIYSGETVSFCGSLLHRILAYLKCFPTRSTSLTEIFPELSETDELFQVKRVQMSYDEISFCSGREASDKLGLASGAEIVFTANAAVVLGVPSAVKRACDYLKMFLTQLTEPNLIWRKPIPLAGRRDYEEMLEMDTVDSATLRAVEAATRTFCIFSRENRESRLVIFSWMKSRRAAAMAMLASPPPVVISEKSHPVSRTISLRLPVFVQSRIFFQAGPDGQDAPAEDLEMRLGVKLTQGSDVNQIKIKTISGDLKDARAGVDDWIESNLCCGTVRLPKFHDVRPSTVAPLLSDLTCRAWISRAVFDAKEDSFFVVGETSAVAKCMKELMSWCNSLKMDVLTKMIPLESVRRRESKAKTADSDDSG